MAFSGTVKDPDSGGEYTEPGMNVDKNGKNIGERQLPDRFASDDFRILRVANKYQTGFDQPLLHTMYVDKRLSGVQAVQTLSRLNRTCPGKEDTFVLDFVNDAEEIRRSFQPYYEQTTVSETADPQQLYELQHRLESAQVFWASEVEAFCKIFFAPKEKQTLADQAEMYRHINPAVDRFKALSEIIEVLNERFGTQFTKADQLLFDQFVQAAKADEEVVQRARANPIDNLALSMRPKVEGLMIDRMEQNQEIVSRYLNDPQFQDLAFRLLVKRIYDEVRTAPVGIGVVLPFRRVAPQRDDDAPRRCQTLGASVFSSSHMSRMGMPD